MSESCLSDYVPNFEGHSLTIQENGVRRKIRCIQKIGKGGWGVVYRAEDIDNPGNFYAVKVLAMHRMDAAQIRLVKKEINLHRLCAKDNSSNVVQIICTVYDDDYHYIVTEFCEKGDLRKNIWSSSYVRDDDAIREIFLQILDAIESCHSLGVFHRDLKPENILVRKDGKVAIGDFGFATRRRRSNQLNLGTTAFMSPELFGGVYGEARSYSTRRVDIWALGVTLIELIMRRVPWEQVTLPHVQAVHADKFVRKRRISRAANDIIKGIFQLDPAERLSIPEIRRRICNVKTFRPEGLVKRVKNAIVERRVRESSERKAEPLRVVNGAASNSSSKSEAAGISKLINEFPLPPKHCPLPPSSSPEIGSLFLSTDGTPRVPIDVVDIPGDDMADDIAVVNESSDSESSDSESSDGGSSGIVCNCRDCGGNESSDSDTDSKGPITPETHAVDELNEGNTEDFGAFDLADAIAIALVVSDDEDDQVTGDQVPAPKMHNEQNVQPARTHQDTPGIAVDVGVVQQVAPKLPPRNPARGSPGPYRFEID
ncbi:kinase-like protein [Fomitiporia mediterranea MF3/22]|uniref:kinase-like protein n=1 Tax=Fomitiporia mediterranea (strain MF3/22) TaxID=694068 RepID=UPI0004408F58|nr:kinase-like protein [Fomitiporia mediterranea MF3/22]EJD05473.1 kinase-like protein [Fomitiporia mediterranea MF3/22]